MMLALIMVFSASPAIFGLFVLADEPVVETVYVNGTYTGTDSDGSKDKPFLNLNTAFYYLANSGVSPDEAVILVTGDTPLAETIKERAQDRYYRVSSVVAAGSGNNLRILFQPDALDFPLTIRGAGGKLTQSFETVKDVADPSIANPENLVGIIINFYVRSDLTFDNIVFDAYATTTFLCQNAVSLTFEEDVKVNGVNAENFNITCNKLGNTLNLLGGDFSVITMDNTNSASAGSASSAVIGAGVTVDTFYGCGKTETATYDVSGVIDTMYLGGIKNGAVGIRTLNLRGGSIGTLYFGAAAETATSSANYILNLYGGEFTTLYTTGLGGVACSGTKTVNAYDGYEYAITESALPDFDVRNENRANPPAGKVPSYTIYVGLGGDDSMNGKTPETKMASLTAAINRANSLYKRDVAEAFVIRVVGSVELDDPSVNYYTSPKFEYPLTIQGGTVYTSVSSSHYVCIFQGNITFKNAVLNLGGITNAFLYAQDSSGPTVVIKPEAAYDITFDNSTFSAAGEARCIGRSSADVKIINGSVMDTVAGGKTLLIADSAANKVYGAHNNDVKNCDTHVTIRNSSVSTVYAGGYIVLVNKAYLRLELGTTVGTVMANFSSGEIGYDSSMQEFELVFAGGSSKSTWGKGDNYYKFNKHTTGEVFGGSKIIVEGNVGVKYAPKESQCVDFDSYEVIGFNENVKETVYVDPAYAGGDSDGSKTKPFLSMLDAFENFASFGDDGTIILLSDAEIANGAAIPAFNGNITITSNKKATLYLGSDAENVINLPGQVTLKNITLAVNSADPASATLYGNGKGLGFDAGVTVDENCDLTVYGGAESGSVRGVKMTLKSGNFKKVVVGNKDGEVSDEIELTVDGAIIETLICGNENGDVLGSVDTWIEKGTVENLYAANYESGSAKSAGVLLRNKNAKVTGLLTANHKDGTPSVEDGGDTVLKKLGSSKVPADEFVTGFNDVSNTTAATIYVNGKTKVKIENADGSKSKPYNNLIDAFIAADSAEANAGKFLESIQIVVRGETELAENNRSKVSAAALQYIGMRGGAGADGTIPTLVTTVTTPAISTPVFIRGSGSGRIVAEHCEKFQYPGDIVRKVISDERQFMPSASITWRNIVMETTNTRTTIRPKPGYSSYYTETFDRTGGGFYLYSSVGEGVKTMVFAGTYNYIWMGSGGDAEVIIGGNTRITGFVTGVDGGGSTLVEILGGNVVCVHGGPYTGTMNADTTITVVGGTVGKIYAAGVSGVLNGNIRVNLGGGLVSGAIDAHTINSIGQHNGKATLRYTLEFAMKAQTAKNFDSSKMVDRIVATGDDGAILIWSGALLFAIASVAALFVFRRRKRYGEN